ncbi:MAG: hypothetical protein BIFFINMI_01369 [Phycisphaerae bacterium]|nr:hypothetical protein [Phycisphaerae bacterium]
MLRAWAQETFNRLPVLARDLYHSARGVGVRAVELGPEFRRWLAFLKQSQWWDAGRIRDYQDARVRELAALAYATVPFYRGWFDAAGVRPGDIRTQEDLRRLPVLTKQLVREHQGRMVSRAYRNRIWEVKRTSGTTGTSVTIPRAPEMRPLNRAIFWRHRDQFGVRPFDRMVAFAPRTAISPSRRRPPFWWNDWFTRRAWVSLAHLSEANMPAIVAWFSRFRPVMLGGWPSAMHLVATWMLENGVRLPRPPRLVSVASETLLPEVEERLARAFEAPISSMYGQAEFAGHAVRCRHGRFHLDFECCCMEQCPVPEAGPGVVSLIFTGWGNPAMPFIRYEVGDLAAPATDACPCGRQSPALLRIEGRADDAIRTPDGRRVVGLMAHLPSAREVQICQDRLDHLEIRVVPGPDYDPGQEAELIRRLRVQLGDGFAFDVVKLESIPRGPAGLRKFRAVVSEIPPSPDAPPPPPSPAEGVA